MGGLFVPVEGPLVEHPGVPAYGGQWGSQLVACVGGEAPLAREGLFPAPESGIETRQQAVYGIARRPISSFGFATGSRFARSPSPISRAVAVTTSTGLSAVRASRYAPPMERMKAAPIPAARMVPTASTPSSADS